MLWRAEQREAEALEAAPPSRELLAEGEGDLQRSRSSASASRPPATTGSIALLSTLWIFIYYVYLFDFAQKRQ